MIIVTERIGVAQGKMSVAMDWAERVWKAIEASDSLGPKMWLLRTVAGIPNRFTFTTQYSSMGEWEEAMKKRFLKEN